MKLENPTVAYLLGSIRVGNIQAGVHKIVLAICAKSDSDPWKANYEYVCPEKQAPEVAVPISEMSWSSPTALVPGTFVCSVHFKNNGSQSDSVTIEFELIDVEARELEMQRSIIVSRRIGSFLSRVLELEKKIREMSVIDSATATKMQNDIKSLTKDLESAKNTTSTMSAEVTKLTNRLNEIDKSFKEAFELHSKAVIDEVSRLCKDTEGRLGKTSAELQSGLTNLGKTLTDHVTKCDEDKTKQNAVFDQFQQALVDIQKTLDKKGKEEPAKPAPSPTSTPAPAPDESKGSKNPPTPPAAVPPQNTPPTPPVVTAPPAPAAGGSTGGSRKSNGLFGLLGVLGILALLFGFGMWLYAYAKDQHHNRSDESRALPAATTPSVVTTTNGATVSGSVTNASDLATKVAAEESRKANALRQQNETLRQQLADAEYARKVAASNSSTGVSIIIHGSVTGSVIQTGSGSVTNVNNWSGNRDQGPRRERPNEQSSYAPEPAPAPTAYYLPPPPVAPQPVVYVAQTYRYVPQRQITVGDMFGYNY